MNIEPNQSIPPKLKEYCTDLLYPFLLKCYKNNVNPNEINNVNPIQFIKNEMHFKLLDIIELLLPIEMVYIQRYDAWKIIKIKWIFGQIIKISQKCSQIFKIKIKTILNDNEKTNLFNFYSGSIKQNCILSDIEQNNNLFVRPIGLLHDKFNIKLYESLLGLNNLNNFQINNQKNYDSFIWL